MANLFCYGTLEFPALMRALTGRHFRRLPGTLHGYVRRSVRHQSYPAIITGAGASTAGVLYRGIDQRTLRLVDRYEGNLYRRQWVEIEIMNGKKLRAWTYVIAGNRQHYLANAGWDGKDFARRHLSGALRQLQMP